MTQKEINNCFYKIIQLPIRKRVSCVFFATEKVHNLWPEHCFAYGIPDYSTELMDFIRDWLSGKSEREGLKKSCDLFYKTLPRNLANENEPASGYAGWSLHDVAMIALEQCEDVEPDILARAVFYAAAAANKSKHRSFGITTSMLSEGELLFFEKWYSSCTDSFPELK